MLNRLRRVWAAVGVATLALCGSAVTFAAPASAATYTCNDILVAGWIPANFSAEPDTACYLNTGRYTYKGTLAFQESYNLCYASKYGWTQLATDGVFGAKTAAAVVNVQRVHGLPQDGKYGPQTASVFRSYLTTPSQFGLCIHWTP